MKMLLITSSFPNDKSIGGIFIPDTIRALNTLGVQVHVLTQNFDNHNSITKTLWDGCSITYFGWHGGNTPLVELMRRRIFGIPLAFQYFINGYLSGKTISNTRLETKRQHNRTYCSPHFQPELGKAAPQRAHSPHAAPFRGVDALPTRTWSAPRDPATPPRSPARAVAAGCQRIVAVGGDGTVNEVAQVLIHTPATLGLGPPACPRKRPRPPPGPAEDLLPGSRTRRPDPEAAPWKSTRARSTGAPS